MDFTIAVAEAVAGVVKLKVFADAGVNAMEGGGVESSDCSLKRSASSVTVDVGSDSGSEGRVVVGLNSDVAGKRTVRALVLHGVDATISVTTASIESRLDVVARVSGFQSCTDRCWVTSVEAERMRLAIDGGVHLDRSTVTVANLPTSRRYVLAVETKSVPAGNWELGVGIGRRNARDVVMTSVTVAVVVTAAGVYFAVSRDSSTVVVEVESTADSAVHTGKDGHVVSSQISVERTAFSAASNSSSGADISHVRLDSGVTIKLSRSLGWASGRVETSVTVTATSHEPIFDSGTVVGEVESAADRGRITGVEFGVDTGSIGESRVHADQSTVSVASHPSSIRNTHSIDEDSGIARDRVLGRTDRSGRVNGGISDVTVVSEVTAVGGNESVSRKLSLVVVEFKGFAEIHGGAEVGRHVVGSNETMDVSAHSITVGFGSDVDVGDTSLNRLDSDVALQRRSGLLGWDAGRIKTSISLTTATADSRLDLLTSVDNVQLMADGSWITSIPIGLHVGSVQSGVEADESTVSHTCLPSSDGDSSIVQEDTLETDNREVVFTRSRRRNRNVALEDVAVVRIVTATSRDGTIGLKGVTVVIESKLAADLFGNAGEDSEVDAIDHRLK